MNVGILPPPTQYATPPRAVGGAPIRPAQTPGGIGDSLDWRRHNWQVTQDAVYRSARSSQWQYGARVTSATVSAATNNYVGTALSATGHVFATPFVATGGLVFDPVNNTTSVLGSFGGSPNFTGAVLLNDGRIFVIPRASSTARIVDITNRTVATTAAVFPGGNAYTGGCLFDNGRRVYLCPGTQATAGIYDIQRDSLVTPAGTFSFTGNVATTGCLLLPDGRIFVAPGQHTAAIYNPVSDSLFSSSLSLGGYIYWGAVLLPSGDEVMILPNAATAAVIYDWRRDTVRTATGTTTSNLGGQLAPDGSVFIMSGSTNASRSYRPETDTMTALSETNAVNTPYAGSHVVPDGRLVMMPRSDSAVRTFGTRNGPAFDPNVQLSPYYNHR